MIEVGEYIRTPYCTIEKITDIQLEENKIYDDMVFTDKSVYGFRWLKQHNVKHSKNIIDLIEVGDYVISKDGIEGKVNYLMLPLKIFVDGEEVLNEDIKSIVTKEQMEAIKYVVE